ncbi:MAG: pseudouridine synthase [Lachnospiraceae bacterium]
MIRLDKYLADMGCGTRQEVKKFIRSGQVSVDGIVVKKPETKVEQTVQEVFLNGEKVGYESFEYYMLNKPAGVISATEDQSCQTVVDLIKDKKRKDLFPVGRLDKDTEGLLLITNDGALAHRLLSPKKHVDKCYFARICGKVTEEDVRSFEKGVNIGSQEQPEITMPGKLEIITSDDISKIRLTIQEGKFHQVKRIFQAVGKEVIYLKRLRMGTLILDENLGIGEYRPLTKEELEKL